MNITTREPHNRHEKMSTNKSTTTAIVGRGLSYAVLLIPERRAEMGPLTKEATETRQLFESKFHTGDVRQVIFAGLQLYMTAECIFKIKDRMEEFLTEKGLNQTGDLYMSLEEFDDITEEITKRLEDEFPAECHLNASKKSDILFDPAYIKMWTNEAKGMGLTVPQYCANFARDFNVMKLQHPAPLSSSLEPVGGKTKEKVEASEADGSKKKRKKTKKMFSRMSKAYRRQSFKKKAQS